MRVNPRCPKCGETMFGPRYETMFGERLRYTCGCGYTMTTPTLDAEEKEDENDD